MVIDQDFQTMEPTETMSSWEGTQQNYWHCPNQKLRPWPETKRFPSKEIRLLRISFHSQQAAQAVDEPFLFVLH